MPMGSPVGATSGGTVVQVVNNHSIYGNYVVVKDAQGNLHQYSHLSSSNVKNGQTINGGAILGKAGSTGRSTGSHLDYMVKNASGKYVDPTNYILGKSSSSSSTVNSGGYTNWKKYGSQPQTFNVQMQSAIGKGVPSDQARALTELIGRESSWNSKAQNPSSSAYGYGQFLSSTRSQYEKKYGLSYSDPVNQIVLTYKYVMDRYGSATKALQFWDKNKWY